MSELTYKKIIDVEQVETLNDGATVFVNDNGTMKQIGADKFGTVKSIDGIMPDENGNVQYWRSNPIPFSKNGAILKCAKSFTEAIEIASSGTNQANVTLAVQVFDASTTTLSAETKYASSVIVGLNVSTGERMWLQADFDMDDGSVIRLRLNPDESITETMIKPKNSIEPIFININALDQVSLSFDEAFALSVPELAARLCMCHGDSQYGYSVTNVMKNNSLTWGPHICWECTELSPTRDATVYYSTKYYIWTEFSIQELPLAR